VPSNCTDLIVAETIGCDNCAEGYTDA